jgi:hypothetical protein
MRSLRANELITAMLSVMLSIAALSSSCDFTRRHFDLRCAGILDAATFADVHGTARSARRFRRSARAPTAPCRDLR